MKKRCLPFLLCFFMYHCAQAQPEKSFMDVFSNPQHPSKILGNMDFPDIRGLQIPMRHDATLFYTQEPIVAPGLHTIRDIDESTWWDEAYCSYFSGEGRSRDVRGTPQPGMVEYSVDRDFSIQRVISHNQGRRDETSWNMFGELEDGTVFHFEASCGLTGFDCCGNWRIIYAPNWEDMINNLSPGEMWDLVSGLDTSQEYYTLLHQNSDKAEAFKKLFLPVVGKKNT